MVQSFLRSLKNFSQRNPKPPPFPSQHCERINLCFKVYFRYTYIKSPIYLFSPCNHWHPSPKTILCPQRKLNMLSSFSFQPWVFPKILVTFPRNNPYLSQKSPIVLPSFPMPFPSGTYVGLRLYSSSPLCFYPRVIIFFPRVLCATYQRIMFHLPEDSYVLFPEDRMQFSQRIIYHSYQQKV